MHLWFTEISKILHTRVHPMVSIKEEIFNNVILYSFLS